jgi:hypothetical protein
MNCNVKTNRCVKSWTPMFKRIIRKRRHKMFVDRYIVELQWDSLNTMLVASATQWNDDVVNLLNNNARLIRKYQRRKRWLKF